MPPKRGEVRLRWRTDTGFVAIEVLDEGDGRGEREPVRAVLHHQARRLGLALVRAIAKLWLPLHDI